MDISRLVQYLQLHSAVSSSCSYTSYAVKCIHFRDFFDFFFLDFVLELDISSVGETGTAWRALNSRELPAIRSSSSTELGFLVRRRFGGGGDTSPSDEIGDAGAAWRLEKRGIRIGGGDIGFSSPGEEPLGEAGPRGDKGETGPSGPGLTGEAGDTPWPCRSGGDGVSSPDDGGDGGDTGCALLLRRTGGVFLGPEGEGDGRLGIPANGGGDGDIDSYEPLLVLLVCFLGILPGGGETESRLIRILSAGGDSDFSILLLWTGGGEGEASSRYKVPRSVIPVMGGDLEPSLYIGGGGEYTRIRSGTGDGLLSSLYNVPLSVIPVFPGPSWTSSGG